MTRFLVTTALSLILANSALAQSGDRHTNSNPSKDPQAQSDSAARRDNSTPRTENAPQSQSSSSKASDRGSSANDSANSNQPSKSGDTDRATANQQQPSRSESADSNARTQGAQGASNSKSTSQQTQNPAPSNQAGNPSTTSNTSSQAQQNAPRDNTNQAQQTSPRDNADQADRTNSPENADRASRDNDRGTRDNDRANRDNDSGRAAQSTTETGRASSDGASVKISEQQRTQVNEAVSKLNVRPVTNVNFSLSVGTVVPRDVQLATLPRDVIDIVPEYRGYSFALVKDEIAIVDPATYKIVAVLPYSGRSTAAAPAPSGRSKITFSDKEREIIRKQARTRVEGRTAERRTTGSTARTEIRTGERVPESVEIEEFPAEVYREAPTLREYRYIHRDNHTYIVEPGDRRVIEDIE
jgi:hypothetical protein